MHEDCVIFDIDGVVCDISPTLAVLKQGKGTDPEWKPDWNLLYNDETCLAHGVYEGWAAVLRSAYQGGFHVVLLTNRFEWMRSATERWLAKHSLPFHELRMRDAHHYNQSKAAHLDEMAELGYQFLWAVDDDPFHGEMYINRGIPFVYAHSGYYGDGRIEDRHLHFLDDTGAQPA